MSKPKASRILGFKLTGRLTEEQRSLYCVQFNTVDLRHANKFATVGGNKATIYEALSGGECKIVHVYKDVESSECLHTCAWSVDLDTGEPLLVVAGKNGVLRVIKCSSMTVQSLTGHGNAINEIRTHPCNPDLVATVSSDESARLWNIKTGVCVAVLSGDGGHRGEVLTVDFHSSGAKLVTGGMDHSLKIWDLEKLADKIKASYKYCIQHSHYRPKMIQKPVLSANAVHRNYVDSVRWWGDVLISKSVENVIVVWRPRPSLKGVETLKTLKLPECNIWYIRLEISFDQKMLACGNKAGTILLWDLTQLQSAPVSRLSNRTAACTIRHVCFCADSSILLSVNDQGVIRRWDRQT